MASVADIYWPIRQGTDIAFLSGLAKYLLDNDQIQHRYVAAYTNAGFVVKEGYGFEDGLFTGYDPEKRDYDKTTWDYEIGPDGYAVIDPTMQHPRCVMQLLKKHIAIYTPEMVSRICGSPQDKFLEVCRTIATTASPERTMASLYALGWTHHAKGSQNIRSMCIVQTLFGNIGMLRRRYTRLALTQPVRVPAEPAQPATVRRAPSGSRQRSAQRRYCWCW